MKKTEQKGLLSVPLVVWRNIVFVHGTMVQWGVSYDSLHVFFIMG